MCSDAPNTDGLNFQAVKSAELADKAFEWFTNEYNRTAPDRERAADEASQVAQEQLATMRQQNQLANEYATYNRETIRPVEQRMAAEALAYDTPERRNAEAARAVADIDIARGRQRQASTAELAAYGISPESTKSQAIMSSQDVNAARMSAGAAAGARERVESGGWARMADVASLGRGLPSAQATAVATGTGAGNSAIGASGAGLSAQYSGAGLMSTGFNTALQGHGQAGNLYGQAANIDSRTRGQDMEFLGSATDVFNLGGKIFSDPKVKKDRKAESQTASMAALRKTPIESWKYDPEKGGPPDGDETRVGPMADAANQNMGEDVAPGGEMLDVASMLGVVANAVKNVDQRLARLEQRKAG